MIPKKLHYCWLSGDPMPQDTLKCLQTWQSIMPDYELVLWDTSKFDIYSVPFVAEACSVKKWAFAADYIRLYALYSEGGIYLDTDVVIKKTFNNFLSYSFFTAVEYHLEIVKSQKAYELLNENGSLKEPYLERPFRRGIGIQAAIMGSIKGHSYLKDCLEWYNKQHFLLDDGAYFSEILAPAIYADIAVEYGFRYKDEIQNLRENMVVFPSSVFAASLNDVTKEAYAVHCCNGSWRGSKSKLYRYLKNNIVMRKVFGQKNLLTIDDVIAYSAT